MHSHLTRTKPRTTIDNCYSSWADIIFGVPQGSILDHFFNIFYDFAGNTDGSTSYIIGDDINQVLL